MFILLSLFVNIMTNPMSCGLNHQEHEYFNRIDYQLASVVLTLIVIALIICYTHILYIFVLNDEKLEGK